VVSTINMQCNYCTSVFYAITPSCVTSDNTKVQIQRLKLPRTKILKDCIVIAADCAIDNHYFGKVSHLCKLNSPSKFLLHPRRLIV